jgi:hypothetical protein
MRLHGAISQKALIFNLNIWLRFILHYLTTTYFGLSGPSSEAQYYIFRNYRDETRSGKRIKKKTQPKN